MTGEAGKRHAARAALDEVRSGWVIGVGTGSTTELFIDLLITIRDRVDGAVASSRRTAERLRAAGIRLLELADVGELPLYVDGADEATLDRRLIKGGGGALTREKIVAASSETFVCIVDDSKLVDRLGRFPLPIEIVAMAERYIVGELRRLGGRPVRRANFLSDEGHPILDVHDLVIDDPAGLESDLNQLTGVISVGLFCRRPADRLIVGASSGVTLI